MVNGFFEKLLCTAHRNGKKQLNLRGYASLTDDNSPDPEGILNNFQVLDGISDSTDRPAPAQLTLGCKHVLAKYQLARLNESSYPDGLFATTVGDEFRIMFKNLRMLQKRNTRPCWCLKGLSPEDGHKLKTLVEKLRKFAETEEVADDEVVMVWTDLPESVVPEPIVGTTICGIPREFIPEDMRDMQEWLVTMS